MPFNMDETITDTSSPRTSGTKRGFHWESDAQNSMKKQKRIDDYMNSDKKKKSSNNAYEILNDDDEGRMFKAGTFVS